MSDLDDAMLERMIHIVYEEHTSFSYRNFLDLMKPKTFRNKISKLMKDDIVELDFKSIPTYYTLKGYRFGKAGIPDHTGVTISHNDPVYQMIMNIPMGERSIHNIRLRFTAPKIYESFSVHTAFPKDSINKDIRLPHWNINNAIVQVRIHRTDTVSVIISCSKEPFPLDYNGIIRFFATLAGIRGLLIGIMLVAYNEDIDQNQSIPDYGDWVIKMWHFGRDGLECSKRDFHIAVWKAGGIFERVYTKEYGKRKFPRAEAQECPNKFVIDAVEEKLNLPSMSDSNGQS